MKLIVHNSPTRYWGGDPPRKDNGKEIEVQAIFYHKNGQRYPATMVTIQVDPTEFEIIYEFKVKKCGK